MRRLFSIVFAVAALAAAAPARGADADIKPTPTRAEPDSRAEAKPDAKADAKPDVKSDVKPVSTRAETDAKPAADARTGAKRACLSAAETREEIKERHLREPFAALKFAAQHFKAEALSAKLCRIDDEFVYEIALLHRDGRFIHAHVNATTGKLFEPKRTAAAPPTKN